MNGKSLIWIGIFIGGAIGGYIPALWGDSYFSMSSVIFSTIGSLVGLWAGFKLSQMV